MAQIDARIKQTNGNIIIDNDDNNNNNNDQNDTINEDIKNIGERLNKQQLKADNDGHEIQIHYQSSETIKSECSSSSSGESFEQLFKMFAKFGDSKSTGETITLSNSDKWFKQAKIIEPANKTITTTDTGIYFKQVAKTKKALTLKEFQAFLEKLATVKKVDFNELKNKLQNSGPPATNKTTTAVTSGAIGRLTDHTKYTGSHKQRFDESGKGRGKAGRVDITSNTGYVSGFKATN